MGIQQNNQFTAVDFRYLKDDLLTGAASRQNAFGTTGKLYQVDVDNTQGSSSTGYLKLYDTNLAVTEGTTVPDFIFKIKTGVREIFTFPEGLTFSTGFGYTASQSPGTTAGAVLGSAPTILFTFK
tara:strand:- start:504 stop:878 length:375 start_codon:yes stop_codon:yes gene_type:complete